MKSIPTEPKAPEGVASGTEIERAIAELTPADLERLRSFARNRIKRIGRKAAGRDYEDLLQEAVISFLKGSRRWKLGGNISFVRVLIGAVRSISSNWAKAYYRQENPVLESELITPTQEGEHNAFLEIESVDPNSLERMITNQGEAEAKAELAKMERTFADDAEASLVIEAWRQEMDGPAVRDALGLSETQYESIVRRIRRTARRWIPNGARDV